MNVDPLLIWSNDVEVGGGSVLHLRDLFLDGCHLSAAENVSSVSTDPSGTGRRRGLLFWPVMPAELEAPSCEEDFLKKWVPLGAVAFSKRGLISGPSIRTGLNPRTVLSLGETNGHLW